MVGVNGETLLESDFCYEILLLDKICDYHVPEWNPPFKKSGPAPDLVVWDTVIIMELFKQKTTLQK